MSLRRSRPLTFRPRGLTDSVDGSNTPAGAMNLLTNLVVAPGTESMFVCRPAATLVTDFTALFIAPTTVSCIIVVGPRIYGMIATGQVPGKDSPFCYDISVPGFVAFGGVAVGNLPNSLSPIGDWQPPHMEMIGSKIIVTHPGFSGVGSNFFGVMDVSTPSTPVWSAHNTATNPLPSVPNWVGSFNGRAWYACGNSVIFSDSLVPTTVTNANQVLTLGDSTNVTAMGQLGLYSTTQGGIIQSLIVFKSVGAVYQITGDSATMNLTINLVSGAPGTLAPNTIASNPLGLSYIAPDGLRMMDKSAQVSNPIGAYGEGVSLPFIYALYPTRMCSAYHHNTIRVSVQNGSKATQPWEEYWLDIAAKKWTGPHTFPSVLMAGYDGPFGTAFSGDDFITVPQMLESNLWSQSVVPQLTSTYTENGIGLTYAYRTVLLPDNENMSMNDLNETAVGLILPPTDTVTAIIAQEDGTTLDTVTLTGAGTGPPLWGGFNWGAANWGALTAFFQQYQLSWHEPIVFKQMQVQLTGSSGQGIALGNLYLRYQILGYLLQNAS